VREVLTLTALAGLLGACGGGDKPVAAAETVAKQDAEGPPSAASITETPPAPEAAPDTGSASQPREESAAEAGEEATPSEVGPPLPAGSEGSPLRRDEDWMALRTQLEEMGDLDSLAVLQIMEEATDEGAGTRGIKVAHSDTSLTGLYFDILRCKISSDDNVRSGNPFKIQQKDALYNAKIAEILRRYRGRVFTLEFEVAGITTDYAILRWSSLPIQLLPPDMVAAGVIVSGETNQVMADILRSRHELHEANSVYGAELGDIYGVNAERNFAAVQSNIRDGGFSVTASIVQRIALWSIDRSQDTWGYAKGLYRVVTEDPLQLLLPVSLELSRRPGSAISWDELAHPSFLVARAVPGVTISRAQLQNFDVGDTVECSVVVDDLIISGASWVGDVNPDIPQPPLPRRAVVVVLRWATLGAKPLVSRSGVPVATGDESRQIVPGDIDGYWKLYQQLVEDDGVLGSTFVCRGIIEMRMENGQIYTAAEKWYGEEAEYHGEGLLKLKPEKAYVSAVNTVGATWDMRIREPDSYAQFVTWFRAEKGAFAGYITNGSGAVGPAHLERVDEAAAAKNTKPPAFKSMWEYWVHGMGLRGEQVANNQSRLLGYLELSEAGGVPSVTVADWDGLGVLSTRTRKPKSIEVVTMEKDEIVLRFHRPNRPVELLTLRRENPFKFNGTVESEDGTQQIVLQKR